MENKNMLSVIVPVYNAEKWIEKNLNSLVNQTYPEMEIIYVDDGSSDESCAIISKYKEQYPQIKLIHQVNSGVSAARNNGIEYATGEYIAFVDADDYVELNMYSKMLDALNTEKSDIVFSRFVRFWENGKKCYTVENNMEKLVENHNDIKYFLYSTPGKTAGEYLYTDDIHGAIWRSVYKSEIIKENNIHFHSDLKFAEDRIFILEYLSKCNKASIVDDALYWYRGATKKWVYHDLYENDMNLLKYQTEIINNNTFYSSKQKKQLIGYLNCTTYFMIMNEEFMFKPDAGRVMKAYNKQKSFRKLLTPYSFYQKMKIRKEYKRIFLYLLIKLRLWGVIKYFYPNKKY